MRNKEALLAAIAVLTAGAIFVLSQVGLRLGLDLQGGTQLTIQVQTNEEVQTIGSRELEAVLVVVRNRVDTLGVSEPVVQTVGTDRVLVQLPGIDDPAQAERVLGGTAQLDFREEAADGELSAQLTVRQNELAELLQQLALREASASPEERAELEADLEAKNAEIAEINDRIFQKVGLTGKDLTDANVLTTPSPNLWSVGIDFNREGGRQFAELTKRIAGTGRRIGIFLDGELISAAGVSAQYAETGITGNSARIDGNFEIERASDLVAQLRGGSLPVPVEIVENRTVGATLGRDSIRRSIYAGVAGIVLVLVFMVVYYRLPGGIANISLTLYALFTLAAYALLGVTLTLPGIAGFILSIGMAVDANVLIFERTREELKAGKTLYRSVESGFYRAFSSILDSNVTTLIACLALFWFGAGLVKGFALTLGVGVGISMFTAISCSRTLMFYAISKPEFKKVDLFYPNLQVKES
ncbi:MAG: protein translocase subunit SecD [Geitlerinemataceae cyanobacterium]|mgnify:CR=1 FL=1